jgi:hypothetical protein
VLLGLCEVCAVFERSFRRHGGKDGLISILIDVVNTLIEECRAHKGTSVQSCRARCQFSRLAGIGSGTGAERQKVSITDYRTVLVLVLDDCTRSSAYAHDPQSGGPLPHFTSLVPPPDASATLVTSLPPTDVLLSSRCVLPFLFPVSLYMMLISDQICLVVA